VRLFGDGGVKPALPEVVAEFEHDFWIGSPHRHCDYQRTQHGEQFVAGAQKIVETNSALRR
jgi:hypothetical protein